MKTKETTNRLLRTEVLSRDEGDGVYCRLRAIRENLFGSHEHFGGTLETQVVCQGFSQYRDPAFGRVFDSFHGTRTSQTVQLFERNGAITISDGLFPRPASTIFEGY